MAKAARPTAGSNGGMTPESTHRQTRATAPIAGGNAKIRGRTEGGAELTMTGETPGAAELTSANQTPSR